MHVSMSPKAGKRGGRNGANAGNTQHKIAIVGYEGNHEIFPSQLLLATLIFCCHGEG